ESWRSPRSRKIRGPSRGTNGTSNSQWREKWDGPGGTRRRTPPVPTDTSPRGCRRVGGDRGWTAGRGGYSPNDPMLHWRLSDRRLSDWVGDLPIGEV